VAVAGNGFEQVVGLAGAAPAVVDFGFEVFRQASLRGLAWRCFGVLAAVVAANFEGVAQFVEVLLGGGLLPWCRKRSSLSLMGLRSLSRRQELVSGCRGRRWPL
jgi:hypothetical protein